MGKFLIYVLTQDSHLLDDVMRSLKYPSRVPSLGMDDEMVIIKRAAKITMESGGKHRTQRIYLGRA